ncbi:MAG: hypothetical protein AAGH82_11350 [Pseudomonadota bacterium]
MNIKLSDPAPQIGGQTEVSFTLQYAGDTPAKLAVDTIVHRSLANGKLGSKVFKLATPTVKPGQALALSQVVKFKQLSTRSFYPGPGRVEVQVNGVVLSSVDFVLSN